MAFSFSLSYTHLPAFPSHIQLTVENYQFHLMELSLIQVIHLLAPLQHTHVTLDMTSLEVMRCGFVSLMVNGVEMNLVDVSVSMHAH